MSQHIESAPDRGDHSWHTLTQYRSRLRELPPSAKLVAKILETRAPLNHAELREESLLPDRTVRYALERLESADLVEKRVSFADARKHEYQLRVDQRGFQH